MANSCSTMHKIQEKEFTLEDFSCEHLTSWSLAKFRSVLEFLNIYRNTYLYGGEDLLEDGTTVEYKPKDKNIWWQMIQLLPSGYNQTRNVMFNYEVLANIYIGSVRIISWMSGESFASGLRVCHIQS